MEKEKTGTALDLYNEFITKIVTYEGMFYTLNIHTKEEVMELKELREKNCNHSFKVEEIMDELVREDVCKLVTSECDLIYLPYETKVINRKEIKESLIQFK